MQIETSRDLYASLSALNLLDEAPELWWPAYGTFEVVVGAVLTQNANWKRVEVSLENLRGYALLELEEMLTCKEELLLECIRPSGLFVNKTRVLKTLCSAIKETFGDFESFTCNVTRSWLLAQKGIGKETADSILCYACGREVMVVDAYTHRLLGALGYEFEDYDDLQAWFEVDDAAHAARYHGMIVEYVKRYSCARRVSLEALNICAL